MNTISASQNMLALRRANEIRLARSKLKRNIASGLVDITDVIYRPPAEAQRMTVLELLSSQYRWGEMRCRRALMRVPLPETKLLEKLTDRQRCLLAMTVATINATLKLRDDAIQIEASQSVDQ